MLRRGVIVYMRELKSVEEKILDRALYLIGKNKSTDVSIRAIAKEANVNVSAINYYFRTKEEMLRQVRKFYLLNTLSISSILDGDDKDAEEKLVQAANEIMEYIIRFPGVTVLLHEASSMKDTDEISESIINATKEMHYKIRKLLNCITKGDKSDYQYKLMIFMACITNPIENLEIMDFDKALINDREYRIAYIKKIIEALKAI